MSTPFDQAQRAAELLRDQGAGTPALAVLLGSGFGEALAAMESDLDLPYAALPGFPATTVEGHEGRVRAGSLDGQRLLVFCGRLHAYEGHALAAVVHPVRVAARLGAPALLLTCAAGGLREDLGKGTLVSVRDHLDLAGSNPLRGAHDPRLGPRFPSLRDAYDPEMRARLGFEQVVYARVPGPSYETPAEARALRALGADVVGMSLVPEVIAARQAGLRVAALALVTNPAANLQTSPTTHDEVLAAGRAAHAKVAASIRTLIAAPTPGKKR